MRSAVYEGTVVHHRRTPVDHRFSYRIALPLVDLDEIDQLVGLHPLWAAERHNVVSFWRRDYLPARTGSLGDAVRDLVEARLGRRPGGPVTMLAHPRIWGWLFNPIALFYCFDAEALGVEALVAEVTNTPWHERHVYVVGEPGRHRLRKELHVSPFFDMDMDYELTYTEPGDRLGLSMRTMRGGETLFEAGLRLERVGADRHALGRLIWGHPFGTHRVSGAVYRQALALWRAGAPFVPHPRRPSLPPGAVRTPAPHDTAFGPPALPRPRLPGNARPSRSHEVIGG